MFEHLGTHSRSHGSHHILSIFISAALALAPIHTAQAEEAQNPTASDASDVSGVESQIDSKEEVNPEADAKIKVSPIKSSPVVDFTEFTKTRSHYNTVIIQRNYMPKTDRFFLYGGPTYSPNDVFFRTLGLATKFSYYLSEEWGFELSGIFLGSSSGQEIKDLANNRNGNHYSVSNLVSPKNYLGADVYVSYIYGKAAFNDNAIFPYEMYGNYGIGKISTASFAGSTAFHFGIGQFISLGRSSGLKVDMSFYFYSTRDAAGNSTFADTMLFTIGYGRFFPEANYR